MLWFSTFQIILLIPFWYKSHAQPKVASVNDSTPFCIGLGFLFGLIVFIYSVFVSLRVFNFLKCFPHTVLLLLLLLWL